MHPRTFSRFFNSTAATLAITWSAAFAVFAATVALALCVTDANAATLSPTTAHDDIPGDATLKEIVEGAGATEALEAEAKERKAADETLKDDLQGQIDAAVDAIPKVSLFEQTETQTATTTNEAGEVVETVATNKTGKATVSVGDDGAEFYTAAAMDEAAKAVAAKIAAIPVAKVENGVVSVDGEKSAALDAGEGRTVKAVNVPRKDGQWGHSTNYWKTTGGTWMSGDNGWSFTATNVTNTSIFGLATTYDGKTRPQTNGYTSVLYPDGGRVLTTKMLAMSKYEAGVKNADNARVANFAGNTWWMFPADINYDMARLDEIYFQEITNFYGCVWMATADTDNPESNRWFNAAERSLAQSPLAVQMPVLTYEEKFDQKYGAYLECTGNESRVSYLIPDGTDFVTKKTLGEATALADGKIDLSPAPALTEDQTALGISYEKGGHLQDTAIAIGRGAVASIDPEYVSGVTNKNTKLRSVSVAIGGYSDARTPGGNGQSIAIGYCSQATKANAIAIGSGAQHTNETAMTGGATVANAGNAVAIGYSAKATADDAWQFGTGSNAVRKSLKFYDTYIVKDGKIAVPEVQADVRTNDVQALIRDALAPQTLCDWDESSCIVTAKTHAITTLAPTNSVIDEIEFEPSVSRNYEIYIPNTAQTRQGLPVWFDTSSETAKGVTKLGAWWRRKATRLPLLVKVREPMKDVVLLEATTYDDGTDWTPVVTNAVWRREADTNGVERLTLDKVQGYNLHRVAGAEVSWVSTNGVTNVVAATAVQNPVYSLAYPTFDAGWAGIPVAEVAEGTEPAVAVYELDAAPKATINALREAAAELMEQKKGWR